MLTSQDAIIQLGEKFTFLRLREAGWHVMKDDLIMGSHIYYVSVEDAENDYVISSQHILSKTMLHRSTMLLTEEYVWRSIFKELDKKYTLGYLTCG